MIGYVTVGVEDMTLAKRFYCAFLPALGYSLEEVDGELSFSLPREPGQSLVFPEFYVKHPFNRQPPSPGNGNMTAFEAKNQAQVRALHAAALAAGGTNDGSPGFREIYSPHFYVGYLRDPQGNKIALFSSNLDEPGRDETPEAR